MTDLFAPIEPYDSGMLAVGGQHRIYWEQCGNPSGQPVIFLHGGPGSGCQAEQRRLFDPGHYRIVLFDQRGSGRSTPLADVTDNTTPHLVRDVEALRSHLALDRWLVFGGSWGSTLALAYAEAHPERCTGLILRGVWLCRANEFKWWLYGTRTFFPENWRRFAETIAAEERHDLLAAYHRRLMDADPAVHMPAARAWKSYERNLTVMLPRPGGNDVEESAATLAMSRIMAHYMINGAFMAENALIEGVARIHDVPGIIIQGRYDMICPIVNADDLAQAWPAADYQIIPDAGHKAYEAGTLAALIAATERFKDPA
ncbi:MAG: prolyl aminopeptidase [Rhodospirillales bacterium]|jgi:proline iminopeptidase|nr:prolyl aminopeptidase [Rhodospirillales bacterium]MDP7651666.1 prolyl aminopeptidase [Rhodospirillales bacterium]HJO98126.1 prolyl aminopeptidase [Rhodospirillales bacterium]